MGIGEAIRCRQVCLALSKPSTTLSQESPETEEPGSPGSHFSPSSPDPGRGGARGGASLSGEGATFKHLLFAPPGTTPAQEFPHTLDSSGNENQERKKHGSTVAGSTIPTMSGGARSLDGLLASSKTGGRGVLDSRKTGGRGFGLNFLGRSISAPEPSSSFLGRSLGTPERAIRSAASTSAPARSQTMPSTRDQERVGDVEEGFSLTSAHLCASKGGAREETALREASEVNSACGEEDGLNTLKDDLHTQQTYGSVEEKEKRQSKAKSHMWNKGASQLARLRKKIGGDDQAYGAIAEEGDDDDDVGEGGGREWRQRVSKWYGNR